MSDLDKQNSKLESDHEKMVAIEICGKDPACWEAQEPRFVNRIVNSFKRLFGADIKPDVTANNELLDAADTLAKSAHEALKAPQLYSSERQASIKLKLAEAKEKEASARKVNLEADMLEMEIRKQAIAESQEYIDLLIKRGELIPIEKDGEFFLVYKKREL